MQYDLFNGQRHAASTPLTVADDRIVPLSNNVAVPADPLGSSRRTLCPKRLELVRMALRMFARYRDGSASISDVPISLTPVW